MTNIKIWENDKRNGLVPYIMRVIETKKRLNEYYGVNSVTGKALTYEDANNFARMKCGVTWRYEPTLGFCVDNLREDINKILRYDSKTDTILVAVEALTIDTSSVKSNPDVDNFRGTWGTTLDADAKIYDGDYHDNADTKMGSDPNKIRLSGDRMVSGEDRLPYTGIPTTVIKGDHSNESPLAGKRTVLKLKI